MKLQKIRSHNDDGKPSYEYTITLSGKLIDELKWNSDSELEARRSNTGVKISLVSQPIKNPKPETIQEKMSYSEFKEKIYNALKYRDDGITWAELRVHLELEPVVPNKKWVQQLEKDIGLRRERETNAIVWRIGHV